MPPISDPNPAESGAVAACSDDDEDDYMKMTFDEPPSTTTTAAASSRKSGAGMGRAETSLQRRLRLQREGEARARVKSKAELAAEAEEARERALRTSLLEAERGRKSKGLAMMAKMGFRGGALGRKQAGEGAGGDVEGGGGGGKAGEVGGEERKTASTLTEPIRIEIKDDRGGIGMESERKRKMAEVAEQARETAKKVKVDEGEYRDRVRREREAARLERQVHAAQKIAERMEEEEDGKDVAAGEGAGESRGERAGKGGGPGVSSRPLKSVNVLWRGLVRAREEAERDRRMRYDLEQSLSRLPTYEDVDEDEDDKRALGKGKRPVYEVAEDLDEEDPELEEFSALAPDEKLHKLVEHLRAVHHYCFWCKFTYPDDKMEGCPGLTEEDHD